MEVSVIKTISESDQMFYNQLIKTAKDRKQLNTTGMYQAVQEYRKFHKNFFRTDDPSSSATIPQTVQGA